jgi:hypothetical protein
VRLLHSAARLAAVALLAAAAGLALPAGPAAAATCSDAHGVSVVVDFHELGGGIQATCVAGGGGETAQQLFDDAGIALTYVQRQPGFVCRVSGKPASDPCVNTPPADAYWGLWWSDGKSGSWSYASRGVGSQTVPDGGYVAFSWNGSSSKSSPGVAATAHPTKQTQPASPAPTKKPATKSSPHPAATSPTPAPTRPASSAAPSASVSGAATPSVTTTATPSPSATPTATPSAAASTAAAAPSATPSDDASQGDVAPAASDPTEPDGGLPAWVGPVVVALVLAAGAAVAVVRRRRSPAS